MFASQLHEASQVGFVQRHQQLETAKFGLASLAWKLGQEIPPSPDPITGKPSFSQSDIVNSFNQGALRELVGKAFLQQSKVGVSQENVAALDQAKTDLARAQATKDPAKISAAQQHLQSVMAYAPGQQISVFDPATGKVVVQMGKQSPEDLTKATQTEEEKHVINSEQTVGDMVRMRDQLSGSNVVGMGPTFKNWFFDKIMGNVSPDFVNKERVEGRSSVNWTKQDLINQMRQRYGEHAVERLSSVLPSTGFIENPENARILADQLITTIAEDTARRSVTIGKPPAEHVLRALARMSNEQLDKEIGRGYLSPMIASAAVKIRQLPPGQMPMGFEPKDKSKEAIISPAGPDVPSGKITWDKLFELYKSGKLAPASTTQDPGEE
jgi:hypothetical protein